MEDSGIEDTWPTEVWNVSATKASFLRETVANGSRREILLSGVKDENVPSAEELVASWLPSSRFAHAWLAFEDARDHPIASLE